MAEQRRNTKGYGRSWKKWLVIYLVAGALIYGTRLPDPAVERRLRRRPVRVTGGGSGPFAAVRIRTLSGSDVGRR